MKIVATPASAAMAMRHWLTRRAGEQGRTPASDGWTLGADVLAAVGAGLVTGPRGIRTPTELVELVVVEMAEVAEITPVVEASSAVEFSPVVEEREVEGEPGGLVGDWGSVVEEAPEVRTGPEVLLWSATDSWPLVEI